MVGEEQQIPDYLDGRRDPSWLSLSPWSQSDDEIVDAALGGKSEPFDFIVFQ